MNTIRESTDRKTGPVFRPVYESGFPVKVKVVTTHMGPGGAVAAGTTDAMRTQELHAMVQREVAVQMEAVAVALRQEFREPLSVQPVPVCVQLSDLASDRYGLATPVAIVIEHYEDEVTARWPEVEAFGAGDTESLAVAALRQDIVDLYLDLKETPDSQLGRNAHAIKRVLMRSVVDPRA